MAFWAQAMDMHCSLSQDPEALKKVVRRGYSKVVFIYLFICLLIFHCGKSKYLAAFSQWSSATVVLGFTQKATAQGMVQRMAA